MRFRPYQEALEEASAAMLESKHVKRLGDGRRQRTDNGGQRVEGRGQRKQAQSKSPDGSKGQGEAWGPKKFRRDMFYE